VGRSVGAAARAIEAFYPKKGLTRRLYLQTLLFSIGTGAFLSMGPVFFSKYAGLTPKEIGIGLSVGLGVGVVLGPLMGRLSDFFPPRNVWALVCFLEAASYLCFPLVSTAVALAAVMAVQAVVQSLGNAGRTAYIIGQIPVSERVEAYAYMRSSLNVGFTVGAGLSALIFLTDDRALLVLGPLLAALTLVVNGVLVFGLPQLKARPVVERTRGFGAVGDWAFVRLAVGVGGIEVLEVLLNITVPLWIVRETDADPAWIPVLFAVNTVLVVLLQVPVSRRFDALPHARRGALCCGLGLVVTCLLLATSGFATGVLTLIALGSAYLVLTLTEIVASATSWSVFLAASPESARGEYQAVWRSSFQALRAVCPALFAFLVFGTGGWGWAVMALVFSTCALYVARRVRLLGSARQSAAAV
jgi:MFS family permease